MDDVVYNTFILMALADCVIACAGVAGVVLVLTLLVRTRNAGTVLAALGFALLFCAHLGFAGQWLGLLIGMDADPGGETTLGMLATADGVFSLVAVLAVVSLAAGFWYTYRRFFPSLREITDGGDGRGLL
jgi:hypothetical protein